MKNSPAADLRQDRQPIGRPVVLVVDDDREFRSALADNLRDDGFEVVHVDDPEDLPPLDELGPVDGVITDYHLPRQDGLRFADRFHDRRPSVPIVMVTAWCHAPLVEEVARRGFLHLLYKPVSYGDLLDRLQRHQPGTVALPRASMQIGRPDAPTQARGQVQR